MNLHAFSQENTKKMIRDLSPYFFCEINLLAVLLKARAIFDTFRADLTDVFWNAHNRDINHTAARLNL